MNHCYCSELLYGTIGTDSMAELKEEDSHTAATATQLPTAATGDHSRTLSELHHNDCSCFIMIISLTAENDLCDVLAVIRDLVNWKQLGLQLGLLYSSLEKIDLEQRGRIDSCKIAMLSAWLQQQDNVTSKGVPSLSVLRAALKRMGEHEVDRPILVQETSHSLTRKCVCL